MEITDLNRGDIHYMAYVGPPLQYDFMGATQFRLLSTLGLRANHSLLDFGCGMLRAGRLFISYLVSGKYFSIEPNMWQVNDCTNKQRGSDSVELKNRNLIIIVMPILKLMFLIPNSILLLPSRFFRILEKILY